MKAQSIALLACLFPAAFSFTQLTAQTATPLSNVSESAKSALPNSAVLGIPVQFEPNQGQAANDVRFLSRLPEGEVELTGDGFRLSLGQSGDVPLLSAKFVGMDLNSRAAGEDAGTGRANYYRGSDSARWIRNVPLFAKVRYSNAYPSTDLVYRATRNRLEYDLELKPGAEADNVSLSFTGADAIQIDKSGDLEINAGGRTLRFLAPDSYQIENGKRIEVPSGYRILSRDRIGFSVGDYNHNETLVIDPVVAYATFLFIDSGNSTSPLMSGMALDSSGNLYFITANPNASNGAQTGSNLVKVDANGNTVFKNFIPGIGTALANDASGNVYMAGTALSGFPTTCSSLGNCGSTTNNYGSEFVMKFDPAGNIVYSSTIPSYFDPRQISSLAVNANGNVFLVGAGTIPPVNAFQSGTLGSSALFAELNTIGTAFVFASYLGETTTGQAIALDSAGNIYVAGMLSNGGYGSGTVPLLGDFGAQAGSNGALFLSKFTPDGQTLLFSTALDGASIAGLAVGPDKTVYLAGTYNSAAFPLTPGASKYPLGTGSNPMFAMAINPSLTGLTYSEFLGTGTLSGITLDGQGDLFAAGTEIGDVTPSANALVSDIAPAAFYLEVDPTGKILTSSQFGGRAAIEYPQFIALDAQGDIYLAGGVGGNAGSPAPLGFEPPPDPITVGAAGFGLESSLGGGGLYGFIAKIIPANRPQISLSATPPLMELRNVGTADLHLGAITSDQGPINVGGNCGTTVPAGTACMLVLSTSGSTRPVGNLTINSDAEPNVQTFLVIGNIGPTVTNLLWIDNSKLVFAAQQNNIPSAPEPFTMWNMGITPLPVGPIAADAPLSVTSNCPAILPAAASCVGQAVWTPGSNSFDDISVGYGTQSATSNFLTDTFYAHGTLVASPTALLTLPAGTQINGGINFGTQTIGNPSLYRTVTVANVGARSMSVPSVNLSGDGEFSIAWNSCATNLSPQQSCALGVLYQPTTTDTAQGTLTVSGGSDISNIVLVGTGRSKPLLTSVSIAPSLDFGSEPLGITTSQTVVLTNNGANTLTIANSEIESNLDNASFSMQPGQCATVAPGASCTFTISFAATDVGSNLASLVLSDNALNSPQGVSLNGMGLGPLVGLSFVSFQDVFFANLNTPSAAQSITLTNEGNATLNIGNMATTAGFSETNTCGSSVAAGASCNIALVFTPTQTGNDSGTLTVTDNAGNSPQTVNFIGYGALPGLTLQAMPGYPTSSTVTAGTTALYVLGVGTGAGVSGTITFSCTGAPAYATCTPTSSISLPAFDREDINVSVTTETTSQVPDAGRSKIEAASLGYLGLPALTLLTLALRRRCRPSSWLFFLALGFLMAAFSSCGGSGGAGGGGGDGGGGGTKTVVNKTAPGTYTLTVTATAGNIVSNTETLTLVVQ